MRTLSCPNFRRYAQGNGNSPRRRPWQSSSRPSYLSSHVISHNPDTTAHAQRRRLYLCQSRRRNYRPRKSPNRGRPSRALVEQIGYDDHDGRQHMVCIVRVNDYGARREEERESYIAFLADRGSLWTCSRSRRESTGQFRAGLHQQTRKARSDGRSVTSAHRH